MAKSGRASATRDQAKAWIRSIYPPIIAGLEVELSWLGRRRPSWSFSDSALEYLAPTRERLYAGVHPLLDQFLRYFPAISEQVELHDSAIERLRQECAAAQQVLDSDPEFAAAVDTADRDFKLRAPGSDPLWYGGVPAESRARLAAEYVVNAVPPDGVSPGYTTRDFWLLEGAALLEFRSRHASRFEQQERCIVSCAEATSGLRDSLVRSRDELADRHGLPAAIVELD